MKLTYLTRLHLPFEVILALLILVSIITTTLVPSLVTPHLPDTFALRQRLQPPVGLGGTVEHAFGTDARGRDVLSRILYGGRVSLFISITATTLGLSVGTLLGLLAGYFQALVGHLVMYWVDLQLALPFTLLAIFIALVFGSNLTVLTGLAALSIWPLYTRLTYGLVLSLRERDYVLAAHAIGATSSRILRCHLLPNLFAPLFALTVVSVGRIILLESGLSFIGIGFGPTTPSWGSMIAEGRGYLTNAWWIGILPALVLSLFSLCIGTLGDWLHDLWNVTRPV
jgi:peptide/nickel transport system permease protein